FGRDTSVYFEARARLLAVIVAFVLAWQSYVNPYLLFQTYLTRPDVTTAVNARTADLIQEYDKAQKSFDSVRHRVDTEAPTPTDVAEMNRQLDAMLAKGRDSVDSLANVGVPIGWTADRLKASDFDRVLGVIVYPTQLSAKATTAIAWLLLGG